jgi:hypothetical protein
VRVVYAFIGPPERNPTAVPSCPSNCQSPSTSGTTTRVDPLLCIRVDLTPIGFSLFDIYVKS